MHKPDFDNLLLILNREKPKRPTLFEFFLNVPLYEKLAGRELVEKYSDWKIWEGSPVEIAAFVAVSRR